MAITSVIFASQNGGARLWAEGGQRVRLFDSMLAPALAAFVTAVVGGWAYLRWAAPSVLDVPNQRSSHSRPTPRGGGLAIVAAFFVGLGVWLLAGGSLSPRALGW